MVPKHEATLIKNLFRTMSVVMGLFFVALSVHGQTIEPPLGFPLPVTSGKYNEPTRARIFFKLYPIFNNAYTHFERRDYQGAEKYFKDILVIDPGNNLAKFYLIQIYTYFHSPEKVISLSDQLVEQYPNYTQGYLYRGYAAMSLKNLLLAIRSFEKALTLSLTDTQRIEVQKALAEVYVLTGQEKAAALFKQIYVQTRDPEYLYRAAVINKQHGHYEEAQGQLMQLHQQTKPSPQLAARCALELARIAVFKKEPQKAADYYSQVLTSNPENIEALQGVADGYYQLQKYKEGLPLAQRLVQKDGRAAHYSLLSAFHEKLGNWLLAAEALIQAANRTTQADEKAEILQRVGQIYYQTKNWGSAEHFFGQALLVASKPDQKALLQKEIGLCLIQEKNPKEAADFFRESLKQKFDEETALLFISTLGQLRQWEQVASQGEGMLKTRNITPSSADKIKKEMVFAYKELGRNDLYYRLSKELVQKGISQDLLLEAAEAARRNHRPEEALEKYRQYLSGRFEPKAAMGYYFVLKQEKRYGVGETVLRRILETKTLDPSISIQAQYELGQVFRLTKRNNLYLQQLESLVRKYPTLPLHLEWGEALLADHQVEKALEQFQEILKYPELKTKKRCEIESQIGSILVDQKKAREALSWFDRAEKNCPLDKPSQFKKALALFQLGEYAQAKKILQDLGTEDPRNHFYLALVYYRLGEAGLALTHLQKSDNQSWSAEERHNFQATQAFLLFDQGRFVEALGSVRTALDSKKEKDLELLQIKALARSGCSSQVYEVAGTFLQEDPPPTMAAEAEKILGTCSLINQQTREATEWLTRSLQHNPQDSEALYLRGLAFYREKKYEEAEKDFLAFLEKNPHPTPEFHRDLGFVYWFNGKHKESVEVLEKELAVYPSDLNTVRNAGYSYLKLVDNKKAKEKFARAIDIYRDKLLYLQGDKYTKEFNEMLDIKKEYSKLDKTWGGEFYVGKTDLVKGGGGTLFNGAIPSQFGAQFNYRPPVFGFRDEKIFDVFARFLGNFKSESWSPDEDSYQLGLGVSYKPFRSINYFTSFERLIKIGKNAEDNWLWRNRLSWEREQPPKGGPNIWFSPRGYGEASYFLEDPSRWVFYAEGRLGITWRPFTRLWITPQILGDYRHETNQNPVGCYWEVGIGLSARLWEGEKKYTVDRWYLEGFLGYKWGQFDGLPYGYSQREFEGFYVGISFSK